jgi:hypothetical protein
LHAVAAYGFDILIPSMQGESTICKLRGHFILSNVLSLLYLLVALNHVIKLQISDSILFDSGKAEASTQS